MNLAALLADKGFTPQEVAIVVNETGGMTEISTSHAHIYSLPNGCFTCESPEVLEEALATLATNGVKYVILEGYGITGGDETQDFLKSVPYHFAMIGILPVADWEQNLVNYSALLPTHLTVADTIVVTKSSSEGIPPYITDFLVEHHVDCPINL